MKPNLPPLACVVALLAAGCGGSSGGGEAPGPPIVPAASMRGNTVGDAWTYSVHTNLPVIGNGSGVLTEILGTDTYNSQPSIRDTQTFTLTYPGQVVTISTFSEISMTGQLEAVISSNNLVPVSSETFHTPSTIGLGTDTEGTLTLQDGTTVTSTYKVTGKERVTVPAGTFDCWIVDEEQAQSGGTHDSFTLDVAPETGNWVRANARTNYSGGQVFTWQAQLMSVTTAQNSARFSKPNPVLLNALPHRK